MSSLPLPLDYVDGRAETPAIELDASLCDPNTGRALQRQRASGDDAIERALDTATRVHDEGRWANLDLASRAALLERVADALEPHAETMARLDAQTTGVVLSLTRVLNRLTPATFRMAAQELRAGWMRRSMPGPHGDLEVLYKPRGPAAVISPWNAPTPITAHKTASALAAGAPVIIKPSEWAPHTSEFLARAVEAADLPRGLVQVVHGAGAVGAKLVESRQIRAVSFTGGLQAGTAVARACATQLKPVQLELGGNNALVVLESADLDSTADGVVTALTTLNGQWCRALGRLIVHRAHEEALLVRVESRLRALRLGSSLDAESQMGPLVHQGHLTHVEHAIAALQSRGGDVLQWTARPPLEGWFVPPTLIRGVSTEDAEHEIFGPVATVHTFVDAAEALRMANAAPFGLAAYVFGEESEALAFGRRLEAGDVKVNGVRLLGLSPHAPRAAWKLSGLGTEGARETIEVFAGLSVVGVADRRSAT